MDDAIEPDYGYANVRIWGNRLHGHAGVTFQPMYCGPWYLVRNHVVTKGDALALPNLAEEFEGRSPDLGALEAGIRPPHYGPRDDPGTVPTNWVLTHQR